MYAIELAHRDYVQTALSTAGIATGIHYPIPVHLQKAYENLGYGPGDLPVSETLSDRFLSLPIYPELLPERAIAIVDQIEHAWLDGQDHYIPTLVGREKVHV